MQEKLILKACRIKTVFGIIENWNKKKKMIVSRSVIKPIITLRRTKNVAEWKRIVNFIPILKWKNHNRNQGMCSKKNESLASHIFFLWVPSNLLCLMMREASVSPTSSSYHNLTFWPVIVCSFCLLCRRRQRWCFHFISSSHFMMFFFVVQIAMYESKSVECRCRCERSSRWYGDLNGAECKLLKELESLSS